MIGSQAGYQTNTGGYNVMIGMESGYYNNVGSYNVIMGHKAGQYMTGSFNTYLGFETGKGGQSSAPYSSVVVILMGTYAFMR